MYIIKWTVLLEWSLLEYSESISISLLEASLLLNSISFLFLFLSLCNVPELTMHNNFTFDSGGMSSPKRHVLILLLFIMKWLRMDSFLKLSILNAVYGQSLLSCWASGWCNWFPISPSLRWVVHFAILGDCATRLLRV